MGAAAAWPPQLPGSPSCYEARSNTPALALRGPRQSSGAPLQGASQGECRRPLGLGGTACMRHRQACAPLLQRGPSLRCPEVTTALVPLRLLHSAATPLLQASPEHKVLPMRCRSAVAGPGLSPEACSSGPSERWWRGSPLAPRKGQPSSQEPPRLRLGAHTRCNAAMASSVRQGAAGPRGQEAARGVEGPPQPEAVVGAEAAQGGAEGEGRDGSGWGAAGQQGAGRGSAEEALGEDAVARGPAYLVRREGWGVRQAEASELRAVAALQARVFYEPPPIAVLTSFFLAMFEAEVYSVLRSRAKGNPLDSYVCLVATALEGGGHSHVGSQPESPAANLRTQQEGADDKSRSRTGVEGIAGVVAAASAEDSSVLPHLPGHVDHYLYLTGMGVDSRFRRRRIGSLLLEAAESRALQQGLDHVVLHVHEDNTPARTFYQRTGFVPVSRDPWWASVLLGMKRRLLMAKQLNRDPVDLNRDLPE